MDLLYRLRSDVAVLNGEGVGGYGVRMDEGRVNRDPFIGDCPHYYPVERMMQVVLALSPEPGLLARVPLGQTPSLHALRRFRSPGTFVRALLQYYGFVRIPAVVHRDCTFFLLTTRTPPTGRGQQRDLPGSVQDASVHAWGLRPRGVRLTLGFYFDSGGVAFRSRERRRHSGLKVSRLNTQPAPAPVNASHSPLRDHRHDSEDSVMTCSSL
jgi:hypothetical protein